MPVPSIPAPAFGRDTSEVQLRGVHDDGTYYTPYQAVRAQQLAAATAESVVYCDLFSYMSNLIHTGETTQGLGNWHYVSNNQHHNAYGHDVVARAIFNTIQGNTTWVSDLG